MTRIRPWAPAPGLDEAGRAAQNVVRKAEARMKIYVYVMVLFTLGYAGVWYGAGERLRRLIGPAFYFAVASTWFVGYLTPWPEIFLLWAAGAMFMGVKSRLEVACRYVLMVPLMPAVVPLIMIGSHVVGQFSPTDALGIGAIIASFTARDLPRAPRPRGFRPEEVTILLLVLIFGVASVRLEGLSLLLRTILGQLIALVMPFWILRRNVRTREEVQLVACCLGVSAAAMSVMALYEHHSSWALFDTLSARFADGGVFAARSAMVRGGSLRAASTMGSPIELGIFLMLGLLGIISARRFFRMPEVWLGTMGLIFLGVLATQSRGALLTCVIGLFVVLLVQRRFVACGVIASAAVGAYGMLLILARSSMRVAAFMGAGKEVGVYKDYRTLLLDRGLEEGRKHPWFGVRLSQVFDSLADLRQGEQIIDLVNSYLHIFLVSGAIGLVACLVAITFVYTALWQRVTETLSSPRELSRAFVLAGLTALLIELTSVSFYGRIPWMLMVLVACARVIRATDIKFYRKPVVPVLWETGQLAPPQAVAA